MELSLPFNFIKSNTSIFYFYWKWAILWQGILELEQGDGRLMEVVG